MIAYFEDSLDIIRESISTMDPEVFEELVQESIAAINNNHKIVVTGLGKNVPICEKFVGSMISLGMDASFLHTNSAVHGDMGILKDGDLLIILSKSGETIETVYLLDNLSDRNVNTWLLTFNNKSTLADRIQKKIVIDLRHEGDLWNIMPNNSTTINLMILQGLAMQIAKEKKLDINAFKKNHPGGNIGKLLCEGQVNGE